MTTTYVTELSTTAGMLTVCGTDAGTVSGLWFGGVPERVTFPGAVVRDAGPLGRAVDQLHEYFAGTRTSFDLTIEPIYGTDFQRRVWAELERIPFGETRSYGQVAAALGQPGASRAVGLANGRNPVSIIVPCHRVIGADGSLTGYGGGMDRKSILLDHESQVLSATGTVQ